MVGKARIEESKAIVDTMAQLTQALVDLARVQTCLAEMQASKVTLARPVPKSDAARVGLSELRQY